MSRKASDGTLSAEPLDAGKPMPATYRSGRRPKPKKLHDLDDIRPHRPRGQEPTAPAGEPPRPAALDADPEARVALTCPPDPLRR